jgi:hypothetical protein
VSDGVGNAYFQRWADVDILRSCRPYHFCDSGISARMIGAIVRFTRFPNSCHRLVLINLSLFGEHVSISTYSASLVPGTRSLLSHVFVQELTCWYDASTVQYYYNSATCLTGNIFTPYHDMGHVGRLLNPSVAAELFQTGLSAACVSTIGLR